MIPYYDTLRLFEQRHEISNNVVSQGGTLIFSYIRRLVRLGSKF